MAWQCIFHDIPWHFMKFIATFAACQWMSVDVSGYPWRPVWCHFVSGERPEALTGWGNYRWSYHDLSKCVQKCFSAILFTEFPPGFQHYRCYRRGMLRRLRRLLQWCWSSWWTVTAHSCVHKKHWRLVTAGQDPEQRHFSVSLFIT